MKPSTEVSPYLNTLLKHFILMAFFAIAFSWIFEKRRKRVEDQDKSRESNADGPSKPPKEKSGLFILKNVENSNIDIIAVHGLGGSWAGTWTNRETNKLWLRDFLPDTFPDARVWSYGYDSSTAFSKGVLDIEQAATILLDRVRGACEGDNPIIFISHSLGGIIVKKALIIAHERVHIYKDLLKRVQGIVFFAVPHRGSNVADLATIAANACKYGSLGFTNTNFVKALQKDSKTLENISTQFVERPRGLLIRTFYETEKTNGMMIVEKASACLNIQEEIPVPIPGADHVSICKFREPESQNYLQVLRALQEMVRSVTDDSNLS